MASLSSYHLEPLAALTIEYSGPVLSGTVFSMSQQKGHRRSEILETGVEEMKLETQSTHDGQGRSRTSGLKDEPAARKSSSQTDVKMESGSESTRLIKHSPSLEKHEEVVGGDVTVKMEPGQPPKLARSTSRKILAGPFQLFNDRPSKTEESKDRFQVMTECTYANKFLGHTEHGSMDCDCAEEWGMIIHIFNRAHHT